LKLLRWRFTRTGTFKSRDVPDIRPFFDTGIRYPAGYGTGYALPDIWPDIRYLAKPDIRPDIKPDL